MHCTSSLSRPTLRCASCAWLITKRGINIRSHLYHYTHARTRRRTCVPLVCKAWRDLALDASLWTDTLSLHLHFSCYSQGRKALTATQTYTTFAESVTKWLTRVHARPSKVEVDAAHRADSKHALLHLLHHLNWPVDSIYINLFYNNTLAHAMRVLDSKQHLLNLRRLSLGLLNLHDEDKLTNALTSHCAWLVDLRLRARDVVDGKSYWLAFQDL